MLWILLLLQATNCVPTSFGIYRSDLPNQAQITQYQLAQTPTAQLPYIDNSAVPGRDYYYAVRANCTINGMNVSSIPTAELHVIPSGPVRLLWDYSATTLSPLPPPTGLSVTCAMDAQSATFKWNALPNATGYYLRTEQNGMENDYDQIAGTMFNAPVLSNADYHAWIHGWNASYPGENGSSNGIGYAAFFPLFNCKTVPVVDNIKPSVN